MSRWGKNIVVPLDALCKEKENTNRPTVARSVGTVGKWGKMGFTSTRTYTLSALPAVVAAAAAAAAAASPGQSPASAMDDELSPTVPEAPKPKKFFKSRNTAPPEVIAQIIQQMPRAPTSPMRDSSTVANPGYLSTPVHGREPIKLKLPKSSSAERKKKSPKKSVKSARAEDDDEATAPSPAKGAVAEIKPKKKKEEKKLKPEAPPSRVISRARKTVNYCEDDEDDRLPTPIKDIIVPKTKTAKEEEQPAPTEAASTTPVVSEPALPPPAVPPLSVATANVTAAATVATAPANTTPKTPEHPPIVLRISKGTSRLVSTDSEEQPTNTAASPHQQDTESATTKSRHASTEDVPSAHSNTPTVIHSAPKIIVKPPKPPSPEPPPPSTPQQVSQVVTLLNEHNEINYSTVKISPDKPPKERLKLIIKTDVIRNAIAAAAAADAAKAAAAQKSDGSGAAGGNDSERPEKEKKQKSKKHKHLKHAALEQLMPAAATVVGSEFKTPSPHLALGAEQQAAAAAAAAARTVISPPALSERDFDSQSSVLGSISSKGNSTPQPLAQTVLEESCVIHSRGSSVITSDLETSQHSSLVAPPSDIESRLESMMMDGEMSQRAANLVEETEPLQEDILAVLRGEESQPGAADVKVNGTAENELDSRPSEATKTPQTDAENQPESVNRRVTRGRGRNATVAATKVNHAEVDEPVNQTATRTRGRKAAATVTVAPAQPTVEEPPPKRATRRGRKAVAEETSIPALPEVTESPVKALEADAEMSTPNKLSQEMEVDSATTASQPPTPSPSVTRRGRAARNLNNNNINLSSSNNNNINKIAANLSAKAGAAEEAAAAKGGTTPQNAINTTSSATVSPRTGSTPPAPRSYGRKRKNQQVTQVLQPSAEELEEQQHHGTPAKVANLEPAGSTTEPLSVTAAARSTISSPLAHSQHSLTPTLELHECNSNSNSLPRPPSPSRSPSSPPRRDYKVKDKFKRTLTLDSQVNCNAVGASPTGAGGGSAGGAEEEEQQRGSVKLVISKKKGSIFKSRALVPPDQTEQSAATKRHLYKHRWDAEANGGTAAGANSPPMKTGDTTVPAATRTAAEAIFEDFSEDLSASAQSRDNSPMLSKLTRVVKTNTQSSANPFELTSDAPADVISVKVDRKAKGYYTVVRNVKTAHQIQEIGEYQEMDDDVEYILDALQPHNPTPTRCLSALQLATKCMTPAFRMHVRAHGVVAKFFKALSDANTDLSLGLCTSAIMFILSQEGLNMDLDRDSLELMMNLLVSESVAASSDRANYERNKQKVRELCEEIKAQGKATHLNMDSITVGTLAMETLLSLTSKRAGEWFKEELRTLGGLEHIIKTISDNSRPVLECSSSPTGINWTQSLLDNVQTVERCMRVLENVTQLNEENQKYTLTYAGGSAVNTVCTLYSLCDREIMRYSTAVESTAKDDPGVLMRELLIPVVKVLNNLTHTYNPARALGAEMLGQRTAVIETSFHLLLQAPNYIPDRYVFELSILVLLLLINLTMHTVVNRVMIMKTNAPPEYSSHQQTKVTAVQAVMEYFYKCEELARLVEKNTDAILDNTEKNKKKQEEVDETVNNLLQNSGHHMEHTIKGSYAGILIGHLITDSEEYEAIVRQHLRGSGNGFKDIISVLEKYHTFMDLACSEASAVAHIKSTKKLIDYFRKRDLVYEMNDANDCALPLNLETHHPTTSAAGCTSASAFNDTASGNGSTLPNDLSTGTTTRSSTQRVYKSYSQR